jgi:transposase
MDYQNSLFVGVDTHKNQHTAVIINCFHQSLGYAQTPNDPGSFQEFISKLNSLVHNNESLLFGLEDTQGLGRSLAKWLIDKGYIVKEVNPSLTKRERDHSSNPDKSDKVDAEAIANVLLSKWDKLPSIKKDATYKAIRQLNNHRKSLIKDKTRLKNRLHNLLHQQYPQYQKFFSDPFGKTALAFWENFPHPAKLKHFAEKRLNKFLKDQSKNISNNKAKLILSLVVSKQDISIQTRNSLIPMLVKQLRLIMENLDQINQKLKQVVDKSEYKLTTMPGISYKLAAMFISNIRNINRFDSADKLARYAGLAPAEYSSGKSHKKSFKKYGCRDLNHDFCIILITFLAKYFSSFII